MTGRKARPLVSTMPTSSEPDERAADRADAADHDYTKARIGCSRPCRPAREDRTEHRAGQARRAPAPSAKTTVKSRRIFTPMAIAISRFDAGAHQHCPLFVFATKKYRARATAAPRR